MSRIIQAPFKSLNAAVANGAGAALDVRDYQNITFTIYTTGSTTATVKFAVSNALVKPTFSSVASATNVYDLVQISPINSQLVADKLSGSTGIVISGTDIIKMYEVNSINCSNSIRWICPIISGYSAGAITVEFTGSLDATH